jgi:hypothetical protein
MPANLITPAHFSVSSAINLLKSAGEPRNAELPRSQVGVAEGGVDLPVDLSMISTGAFLGAPTPFQAAWDARETPP